MIIIFNSKGQHLKSFQNDDAFFNQVSAGELLEDHPEFDKATTQWSFVVFPPERVSDLYYKMKKQLLTTPIKEAYGKGVGLIEICKGDYENPTWVLMTADLDMGNLKKNWYLDYCRKHGYVITNYSQDELDSLAPNNREAS